MDLSLVYPSFVDINKADRVSICFMYKYLAPPTTLEEELKMRRVVARFNKFGGFTPEILKKFGNQVEHNKERK